MSPPRLHVPTPSSARHRYGLFSVSTFIEETNVHFQAGVEWEPFDCGPAAGIGNDCVEDTVATTPDKTYTQGVELLQFDPFTVYGNYLCSATGRSLDEAKERARQNLILGEERGVELALYDGVTGVSNLSPHLTSSDTVDITPTPGTAVTLEVGVALLEDYAYDNSPFVPVLWFPRNTASVAASRQILEPYFSRRVLATELNSWAAATTIDGQTGPAGTAAGAGESWIFVTGRPYMRRSEIFSVPPDPRKGFDKGTNDLALLAERTYVVGWQCLQAAVLIDDATSPGASTT